MTNKIIQKAFKHPVKERWLGKVADGALDMHYENQSASLDLDFCRPVPESTVANEPLNLPFLESIFWIRSHFTGWIYNDRHYGELTA